jgi:hypothetical protein
MCIISDKGKDKVEEEREWLLSLAYGKNVSPTTRFTVISGVSFGKYKKFGIRSFH